MTFNGSSHYYQVVNNVDGSSNKTPKLLKPTKEISISAWIKVSSVTSEVQVFGCLQKAGNIIVGDGGLGMWEGFDGLQAQGLSDTNDAGYGMVLFNSSGSIKLGFKARTSTSGTSLVRADSTFTITANTWTHVAISYASGVGTRFYKNGALINTSTTFTGDLDYTLHAQPARIGTDDYATEKYNGAIESVFVWSRAISVAEGGMLYDNPYGIFDCTDMGDMAAFALRGFVDIPSAGVRGGGAATVAKVSTVPITSAGATGGGAARLCLKTPVLGQVSGQTPLLPRNPTVRRSLLALAA
jgi:hypothetical protein